MATVQDILKTKAGDVQRVSPEVTVLEATRVMNQHKIGALVVTVDGRMVGIFTERDVLRRVVAEERNPAEIQVADVMSTSVACCKLETQLDEARGVMKNRRIRHLPVLDGDGRLLGMISIGDLNAYQADDRETTIYMLQEYMYGRV